MRTTVTLDDVLYHQALRYHPNKSLKQLLDDALKRYIQHEAAAQLMKMGGTAPDAPDAPPRRSFE